MYLNSVVNFVALSVAKRASACSLAKGIAALIPCNLNMLYIYRSLYVLMTPLCYGLTREVVRKLAQAGFGETLNLKVFVRDKLMTR